MTTQSLTLRKEQFELLTAACRRSALARTVVRTPDADTHTGRSRLLDFQHDGVTLFWPHELKHEWLQSGATVEVFFEQAGLRYAFKAEALGRVSHRLKSGRQVAALLLSVPVRVGRKQQREHFRVSLTDLEPIELRLTGMLDRGLQLTLMLRNLSCGGLGAVCSAEEGRKLRIGDLCWAEFALPGISAEFEFVARLTHRVMLDNGRRVVLGWAFCAHDDPLRDRRNMQGLSRFVAERQRAKLRRAGGQR